jgi:hypothetical protein
MLRITVHHNPEAVTFQLEGRLAVQELVECWLVTLALQPRTAVRVDLAAVTFADGTGKEVLSAMHDRGAELVATGCLKTTSLPGITRPVLLFIILIPEQAGDDIPVAAVDYPLLLQELEVLARPFGQGSSPVPIDLVLQLSSVVE